MSTLSLELVQGLSGGQLQATLAYLLISFAGGLLVSWAMAALGARLAAHIQAGAQ